MTLINRATYRFVEQELRNYPYLKQEMNEIRLDVIEAGPAKDELGVGIQTNRVSDPTASKGVQLAEHYRLRRIIETVQAIDRALEQMGPECRRLVQLTYLQSDLTPQGIALKMNMSYDTYRKWKSRTVHFVAYHLGVASQIVSLLR